MRLTRARAQCGRYALGVVMVGAMLALGTSSASATSPQPRSARHSGDVDVLSAGSLDTLMTKKIGPAFHRATGYTLVDTSGGSGTLAADIKNKIDVADVFVSASSAEDKILEGSKNGNWVSWYGNFATSPYVLGYYPQSHFATDLRTKPWWKVITMSGFRLGRTDPTQDPGGVLAVKALKSTAKKHPAYGSALRKLASETSDEYPEDTEEADIQNGQLDASFMYESDARSQHSPFVRLTGTKLFGHYTVTRVNHAPHTAAADAFIKFLVGRKGRALMKKDKFGITHPAKLVGHGLPKALKGEFKR